MRDYTGTTKAKISLSIDEKLVTIEDGKGHFFGQYNISNNKKYLVAYCDAHGEVDKQGHESTISGQVYLIQNQNKILWKKGIVRPNDAFVTDDGTSVIIDWLAFKKELSGKVYFFDRNGNKLMEFTFNSNIGGQEISKDGNEVIITTCFPENAIYLFSIKEGKLIKKVKNNTPKRPIINFNFEEIKRYVVKSDKFNQEEYDIQKLREGQKIQEDKERIESLKKKKINDLSYQEIVEIGSIYAGDFYENFGEPKKALYYLLKAIELKKEKPQHYVLKSIGFCYEKIKDYKNAIKYYEEFINRYPQYKKDVVVDHLEFCNLKLTKQLSEDWTSFIIKKREKETILS
ncbi:MAG: tetratricopeptide repeat protein [Candidatus Aenigmarchaeota archaeon]|nr:tetratricopeptide repeat protein [Candidatus Aenigmarchaeota archaeon]